MAKQQSTASQLNEMFSDLKRERQSCVKRIAEIDKTFKTLVFLKGRKGVRAATARKTAPLGRKAKPASKAPAKAKRVQAKATKATKQSAAAKKLPGKRATSPKRGKGTYTQTGHEFVLGELQRGERSTVQLREAWKGAGRGGQPDNSLTDLLKMRKIRRSADPRQRGSIYSLIAPAFMNATASGGAAASP